VSLVSGAAFRIVVYFDPIVWRGEPPAGTTSRDWAAKVVRLSDDWPVTIERGWSAGHAVTMAQEWIRRTNAEPLSGSTVYTNEAGDVVEGPKP
jgi:hypothetical protein